MMRRLASTLSLSMALMLTAVASNGFAQGQAAAQPAATSVPQTPAPSAPIVQAAPVAALWTAAQAMELATWLDNAPADGLPPMTQEASALRAAIASGDPAAFRALAQRHALTLLERHRNGTHSAQRRAFGITPESFAPAEPAIAAALAQGRIDALFTAAIPTHPQYVMMREALASETDPARAERLRLNMDRWRWMPRTLGQRYLLVNVPSYEVTLWQDGQRIDRWRTVVGTTRTPTNIFSTMVSGVIVNPWWEIPTSIANDGVAAMVRTNPRAAAARGYVFEQGRYRQRPGPGNSLGQMKLVMPNDYAIFLHDTPSRGLFANSDRANSHGCVRVNQALDFATALLRARTGWDRAATDAAVATGRTQTLELPEAIPVYISYFTVAPFTAADGSNPLRHFPDIYGHDRAGR